MDTAAALLALAGGALFAGTQLAEHKMNRRIDVAVAPVAYRDDAQSIERGRYLYNSRGCADCHGANGGGHLFLDDPGGMKLKGPNISPGPGSVVGAYRPEDWVRTIRHGVKPSGKPALIMPSEDYDWLTDTDLASIVAYLRHMPGVAGEAATIQLPAPVRLLYAAGLIPDAAERIITACRLHSRCPRR